MKAPKADITASAVTLTWTPSKAPLPAGATATTCYEVVWKENGADKSMTVDTTTATITGLLANTTYKLAVRAITTVDGQVIESLDAKITVKTLQ